MQTRTITMHATQWAVLVTAGIAVAITALTLAPPPEGGLPAGPDKLYHAIAFVALAFPLAVIRPRWSPWLFLVFSAYGAAIELIQPYVGRSREFADFIADVAGIAVGMVLGWIAGRVLKAVGPREPALDS